MRRSRVRLQVGENVLLAVGSRFAVGSVGYAKRPCHVFSKIDLQGRILVTCLWGDVCLSYYSSSRKYRYTDRVPVKQRLKSVLPSVPITPLRHPRPPLAFKSKWFGDSNLAASLGRAGWHRHA